jgi:hypothetical protein
MQLEYLTEFWAAREGESGGARRIKEDPISFLEGGDGNPNYRSNCWRVSPHNPDVVQRPSASGEPMDDRATSRDDGGETPRSYFLEPVLS